MADDLQEPDLPGDEHLGEAPFSDEQVLMALDRAVCSAAGCLEPAECMHFFTSGLSEDAELVFAGGHRPRVAIEPAGLGERAGALGAAVLGRAAADATHAEPRGALR